MCVCVCVCGVGGEVGTCIAYYILFTYFILDHLVLMDKASYIICPIDGPEWRGLWIQDQ